MRSSKAEIMQENGNSWEETMQIPDEGRPKDHWEQAIDEFNNHLRPGEKPRFLVRVVRTWRLK